MIASEGGTPVVLDTNALLLPFAADVDLEEEIARVVGPAQILVPSSIVGELKQLSQGASSAGRHAKAALRYLTRFTVEPTGLAGDDGLLEVARRLHAVVVTNDRVLQEEVKRSGLRVVQAREGRRLAWLGSGPA